MKALKLRCKSEKERKICRGGVKGTRVERNGNIWNGDIMYRRIKMFAPRGDRREFNLPRNKLIDA